MSGARLTRLCRDLGAVGLLALMGACTYGPDEQRAFVGQIVQYEDSYRALVIVQHDLYRRPTGLNAFPNGGAWRFVQRDATQYLVDAERRTATMLMRQSAPDSLWESFMVWIHGIDGDTTVYLNMTGCPRGGECHPSLRKAARFRASPGGRLELVSEFPSGSRLPPVMMARRQGEASYVRMAKEGRYITARFAEGVPYEPLFEVLEDGTLHPVGGKRAK